MSARSSQLSACGEEINITFKSLDELISIALDNNLIQNRLNSIETIVENHFSDNIVSLEQDFFSILLPVVLEISQIIIEANHSILSLNCSEANIYKIKQNLELGLQLLQILNKLLEYIAKNKLVKIQLIEDLPKSILYIIYSIFLHCKQCNNLYNMYLGSLEEILKVFKSAQEVYSRLLTVIQIHIEFKEMYPNQQQVLLEVADRLCDIGEILVGMNMKTMVDTWKCYVSFAEKHKTLIVQDFNPEKPLNFVSSEVLNNYNELSKKEPDLKSKQQLEKVNMFLMKVAVKIFENLWENCINKHKTMLQFFSRVYSILEPGSILENASICNLVTGFLLQYLKESNVLKNSNNVSYVDTVFGFLMFSNIVLQNTSLCVADGFTCNYLNLLMNCIRKDSAALSTKGLLRNGNTLYANIIIYTTSCVMNLNSEGYSLIEELLIESVVQENIWLCIFSIDILSLTLRQTPPTICYNVLIQMIEGLLAENSFLFHYNTTVLIMKQFIKSVYINLPECLQAKLLEQYSPDENVNMWGLIGLGNMPTCKSFLTNVLISKICKKLEALDMESLTFDAFLYVIGSLEILYSILTNDKCEGNKVTEVVYSLWSFDFEDDELLRSTLFTYFLTTLCSVTSVLIWEFNNTQRLQILKLLKGLSQNTPALKAHACQIISALSKTCNIITEDKYYTFSESLDLVHNLITNRNVVVAHIALDLYDTLDVQTHGINLKDYKYIPENITAPIRDEFTENETIVKEKTFETASSVQPAKKMKYNEDVKYALEEIQSQIKAMKKLSARVQFSSEINSEIRDIITKLNNFL